MRGELALWLTRLHREQETITQRVRESTSHSHAEYVALLRARRAAAAERHIKAHMQNWLEWIPMTETDDSTNAGLAFQRRG